MERRGKGGPKGTARDRGSGGGASGAGDGLQNRKAALAGRVSSSRV